MTRISVSSSSSDCDSEVEAEEVSELSEPEDENENENVTFDTNESAFIADSVNSSLSNDIKVKGIINIIYDLIFTVRIMYHNILLSYYIFESSNFIFILEEADEPINESANVKLSQRGIFIFYLYLYLLLSNLTENKLINL